MIDFEKGNGLVPAVVQDANSLQVLMLGYMNQEALEKTQKEGKVTFFSRSKDRLWTKGESSGHFLQLKELLIDCDEDTILIKAIPEGPTCHTGATSCFQEETAKGFVYQLEDTIHKRIESNDPNSYTKKLVEKGINKVAQKVGEEAVELVIESKDDNDELFLNEAADLMYHYLILLKVKGFRFEEVESILKSRSKG